MLDPRAFCSEFDIDLDHALETLARERNEASSVLAMPWYVRLMVGVGAWFTAIVAITLGGALLSLADIPSASFGIAAMILGAVYLGLGLWLMLRTGSHLYIGQLGIAISAAGVAMAAGGAGVEFEALWPALLVSVVLTAVIVRVTASQTLQFLAALLTACLLAFVLVEEQVPYFLGIGALLGLAGAVLMMRPPQRNLSSVALVLLLVFPIFDRLGVGADFFFSEGLVAEGGWFAKALYIGIFLWLVGIHWQSATTPDVRTPLSVFAATAVVVGMLLPPGGMAALMIIMLAFVLGSRPLALLGILLQINYIWRFYYDMEVTLLVKSGIFVAVGAVLVFAWWLMMRRSPDGVRS